jgi:hypothetical protein
VTNPVVDEYGTQRWYRDGVLHREDGPAVIWHDSYRFWYQDGKLHRLDGPATVHPNGIRRWYLDDKQVTEQEHFMLTAFGGANGQPGC